MRKNKDWLFQQFGSIPNWVNHKSRVLDLGCGDGALLEKLVVQKSVDAVGLEIDPKKIAICVGKGLNVIHQDLNGGLNNFSDQCFDVVIMTQTLQAVRRPDIMLKEMLRIGKEAIVTFPNFAHYTNRIQLGLKGHMPISPTLPNPWYNTPNIHLATCSDFNKLCRQMSIKIKDKDFLSNNYNYAFLASTWPNLFAEVAIYRTGLS